MKNPFNVSIALYGTITALESELRAGLDRFWKTAGTVLDGGSIRLVPPAPSDFSLARHFFSMLFLYSYYRAGVPAERRVLYAAVNQCLRGMVTGCDNILDDEYKATLETDLPPHAHRFRSVLDIMVADRVLFAMLQDYCLAHDLPVGLALQASAVSLQALTESGAQEASEEEGVDEQLEPDAVLRTVHHYKTGVLFQSTWAIPALFEKDILPEGLAVRDALYRIGIGCQILDDIVDLFADLRARRHNYVASVLVHREPEALQERMQSMLVTDPGPEHFYAACPEFAGRMKKEAFAMLEDGLRSLFSDEHQALAGPAALFIADRIGVRIDPAKEP